MPHAPPSAGEGEQPGAGAAGAMGMSQLARAPAALARESSRCPHMAGGPEKIGQELPPFTPRYPAPASMRPATAPRPTDSLPANPWPQRPCVRCPRGWPHAQSK